MKNAKQEMNAAIHDAMSKLFSECTARSETIGALYVKSRQLGDNEETLDLQAGIVAEIAAHGVKLAAAFTGMLMTAELSKAVGLTARDIIEAAAADTERNSN